MDEIAARPDRPSALRTCRRGFDRHRLWWAATWKHTPPALSRGAESKVSQSPADAKVRERGGEGGFDDVDGRLVEGAARSSYGVRGRLGARLVRSVGGGGPSGHLHTEHGAFHRAARAPGRRGRRWPRRVRAELRSPRRRGRTTVRRLAADAAAHRALIPHRDR